MLSLCRAILLKLDSLRIKISFKPLTTRCTKGFHDLREKILLLEGKTEAVIPIVD